jgi:hypothetical protein
MRPLFLFVCIDSIGSSFCGLLSQYFKDKRNVPQCGDAGTLRLRLGAGAYYYTLIDGKNLCVQ